MKSARAVTENELLRELLGSNDENDPLVDRYAEHIAVYEHAHGRVRLDPDDLFYDANRALAGLIDRSPASRMELERYSEALMLCPAIRTAHGTAAEFVEWWRWVGSFDRAHLPDELGVYLRDLARYRALRALGLRVISAAEAQDAAAIIAAMRDAIRVLREMGLVSGSKAAA